ncbi:MAG: SDR family oxidoreductase [Planctomycetes bacterium]|nr:SDR family oxidoreductase [Planctomycetota bacterium]MCP4772106.1 SDR family oxidoreductase [Planctomycetota bacterium]MCP4862201.1 SDR family oxidoreductase [Planctomycetota bacterium]
MSTFFDLSGKTAIVTGSGSGIGQAIALRFAQAGAHVAIWDLTLESARKTLQLVQEAGGSGEAAAVNVANAEAVESSVAALQEARSRIDILVNNAGVASVGNVEQTSPEELERVFQVNIAGVANGLRAVAPRMAKQGGGAILNLASIASLIGVADRFAYSTSKGAVLTMTYSVAIDYAKQGVRCNCVCPARIHTPFVDGYLEQNYPDNKEEMFQKLSEYQPIGRMGEPEEVAALAHFLCSDESSFITGAAYPIDGGVCSMPGF